MKKARNKEGEALVDPMATRLGYQLRRVSVQMMADLGARLAPTGLRPAEVSILLIVAANPGCQQGEIGEMLGIKRANMVPLIAGLVTSALVARARADGRSHALSLTPAGQEQVTLLRKLIDRHEVAYLSRLDRKALASLFAALAVLRE